MVSASEKTKLPLNHSHPAIPLFAPPGLWIHIVSQTVPMVFYLASCCDGSMCCIMYAEPPSSNTPKGTQT